MGSFAYTCAVSGLPIEAGDKVRYMLLTKNPYHNGSENTCYIHDLWFPRTFPLKGEYNDYGSVENISDGPEKDIWLEGLKRDLVERGWGENTVHDVPADKNMTFDELLDAVQEGRIVVNRDTDRNSSQIERLLTKADALIARAEGKPVEDLLSKEEKQDMIVPAGIPTMFRIRKIAEKLGISIFDGRWGNSSIIIDEPQNREIRVRCHCMYGQKLAPNEKFVAGAAIKEQVAVLGKLQEALGEYAVMMSAGRNGCGVTGEDKQTYTQPDTELVIRPKPGTRDGMLYGKDKDEPLPVAHCIIREDVWQAMIKQTAHTWDGKEVSIDKFYGGINQYVAKMKKADKREMRWLSMDRDTMKLPGSWIIAKDDIPFTVGLSSHFELMMEKAEQPEDFFKTIAELAFITSILANTRYQWRPSSSAGPQFGEWEAHEKLLKTFAEVAFKQAEKNKAERAEWEKLDS